MNEQALSNLVALGEGFTTEFKRAGTSGLGREICAFADATGGTVLLGVADDREVRGVGNHNRLKSEVRSIARSADPPIAVEIESAGQVLCVRVPARQSKSYSFGGQFFIREGASSQQMSRQEIREFFYKEGSIHFDETACDKFLFDRDLDEENRSLFQCRAKIPVEMESTTAQVGTKSGPRQNQGTGQVERKVQEDPEIFSNSKLQRLADSLEDLTAQVVWHCRAPRTAKEIMALLGLKHRKTFRTNYLQPLLDAGWLEMTIPDKPTSSKQKYRLTDKGRELQNRLRQTR